MMMMLCPPEPSLRTPGSRGWACARVVGRPIAFFPLKYGTRDGGSAAAHCPVAGGHDFNRRSCRHSDRNPGCRRNPRSPSRSCSTTTSVVAQITQPCSAGARRYPAGCSTNGAHPEHTARPQSAPQLTAQADALLLAVWKESPPARQGQIVQPEHRSETAVARDFAEQFPAILRSAAVSFQPSITSWSLPRGRRHQSSIGGDRGTAQQTRSSRSGFHHRSRIPTSSTNSSSLAERPGTAGRLLQSPGTVP